MFAYICIYVYICIPVQVQLPGNSLYKLPPDDNNNEDVHLNSSIMMMIFA
jgi:hypothetical protein